MTEQISKVIVGQADVVEQLLLALFSRGHCLLVGRRGWPGRYWSAPSHRSCTCRSSASSSCPKSWKKSPAR
jgi:hypothetical protein